LVTNFKFLNTPSTLYSGQNVTIDFEFNSEGIKEKQLDLWISVSIGKSPEREIIHKPVIITCQSKQTSKISYVIPEKIQLNNYIIHGYLGHYKQKEVLDSDNFQCEITFRTQKLRCPLCNNENCKTLFSPTNRYFPVRLPLVQCSSCGLLYVNPQPTYEEIVKYYEGWWGNMTASDYVELEQKFDKFYSGICNIVHKMMPSGKVLDVGAGSGTVLKKLKNDGYDVEGIEPGKINVEYFKKEWDIPIVQTDLLSFDSHGKKYGIIMMLEILEHSNEPLKMLQKCLALLEEKGSLLISVPNWDFGRIKYNMSKIGLYDIRHFNPVPEHLFYFNKTTLSGFIKKAGFKSSLTFFPLIRPASEDTFGLEFVRSIWNKGSRLLYLCSGRTINLSPTLIICATK